jgi:hypothetical protein
MTVPRVRGDQFREMKGVKARFLQLVSVLLCSKRGV